MFEIRIPTLGESVTEATIARFYASASTWGDRARILVGRPPAGLSWRHLLGPQPVS